jgi:ABC-type nitrate/sulfonate/bicarbonate transport system ATPase subunit
MPKATVQFSEISFAFSKRKALFEGLSCVLSNNGSGKIIALTGPSGVGKTTFCDLVLGIHKPSKGIVSLTPEGAKVAFIPQRGVIFDELSVLENITCLKYSRTLGKTFREDKVQDVAVSLGLSSVLENATRASSLSGGEAQRVMLARIQTVDCDVLVLDEPCSFLDNRVKESFLAGLRAIVDKQQLLALLVTHVWDEARMVADDVLFFHQPPDKSVSVYLKPITEAERRPPTLDAFFGIHWPNCAVIDLADSAATVAVVGQIPQNVRYVAFRRKSRGAGCIGGRIITMCGDIDKIFHDSSPFFQKEAEEDGRMELEVFFFDENGLLNANTK